MAHKIKVVFRRNYERPPLFWFSVYAPNGRRILLSVEFNRLAKAKEAWRKIREAILKGKWHWETEG